MQQLSEKLNKLLKINYRNIADIKGVK